eukprot:gnl/TRDRNA2_/TRDRNA2_185173_c0_seq1.p1 gnl/TRDRNA2_/TRDRNA2_185173_c0~~gnl/TRDRNA2_/TRDRNA2_185173_c0_seq1.p1  ORF type:complete len:285 (+),score=23.67 gnl/TRDRNA2_/TRDRNA2_185173_c0_seq1:73-927(+)
MPLLQSAAFAPAPMRVSVAVCGGMMLLDEVVISPNDTVDDVRRRIEAELGGPVRALVSPSDGILDGSALIGATRLRGGEVLTVLAPEFTPSIATDALVSAGALSRTPIAMDQSMDAEVTAMQAQIARNAADFGIPTSPLPARLPVTSLRTGQPIQQVGSPAFSFTSSPGYRSRGWSMDSSSPDTAPRSRGWSLDSSTPDPPRSRTWSLDNSAPGSPQRAPEVASPSLRFGMQQVGAPPRPQMVPASPIQVVRIQHAAPVYPVPPSPPPAAYPVSYGTPMQRVIR